jgi:hypothetical protein
VIALRLHRALYRGVCVDEAVQALDRFATMERADEETHWVVRLTSASPERERRLAGELANRALGLTVQRGGA